MNGAPLILASASAVRARILAAAGVAFTIEASGVDEDAVKAQHPGLTPGELALTLAEAKALAVSGRRRGALVLGADQVLALDGRSFDKAESRAGARERLLALRGRVHQLHSGLVAARGGNIVWRCADSAALTMRDFSDAFLDAYLDRAGDALTASVGAYAYEEAGAQLFERVEGDFFTVLGLPLLPVLGMLRDQGVLPE